MNNKYLSKEASFLNDILESEGLTKSSHPILATLSSQVKTVLMILDSNEKYQLKIRNILNRIKETWGNG